MQNTSVLKRTSTRLFCVYDRSYVFAITFSTMAPFHREQGPKALRRQRSVKNLFLKFVVLFIFWSDAVFRHRNFVFISSRLEGSPHPGGPPPPKKVWTIFFQFFFLCFVTHFFPGFFIGSWKFFGVWYATLFGCVERSVLRGLGAAFSRS